MYNQITFQPIQTVLKWDIKFNYFHIQNEYIHCDHLQRIYLVLTFRYKSSGNMQKERFVLIIIIILYYNYHYFL